jgi:hypothetical protein
VKTPINGTPCSIERKVDPSYICVDGVSIVCERRTTSMREGAFKIAGEMLASGKGYESVVIQDPENPEEGAIEMRLTGKDTGE